MNAAAQPQSGDQQGCIVKLNKVGKAKVKLADIVEDKCAGVDAASAFPGACSDAGNLLPDCIHEHVECRLCPMLNSMDAV